MPVKLTRNNSLYGFPNPSVNQFPDPIITNRAPTTADQGQPGQFWVDQLEQSAYVFIQFLSGEAVWVSVVSSGGSGSFTDLTVADNATIGTSSSSAIQIGNDLGSTGVVINSGSAGIAIATGSGATLMLSGDTETTLGSGGTLGILSTTAMTIDADNASLSINSGTGPLNIGTDAFANSITIGNATGATSMSLTTGTGGLAIGATGIVSVAPNAASVASPTATSTQNFNVIRTTFTGFTTAMNASQAFTIVSSKVLATSGCLVQVTNLNASTNGALIQVQGVIQAVGSLAISTKNIGAGALGAGDNVIVTVWIIS